MYPKEKWYIAHRIWSTVAEKQYLEDVTPFPKQDTIHHDVAWAQFRSKLDMTEAYEQTHIKPEEVYKTMFLTIFGTFLSHVIQMGGCNAQSTFQWLMTITFRDFIRKFIHVYLDNIFIVSNSLKEHLEHIIMVLQWLREAYFFLSKSKVDLFSNNLDCLGHVIDDKGIHAESNKMQHIRQWRTPQNYNEVQKFLGLVQYLAQIMPYVTAYTTLLSGSGYNNWSFQWTPLLDKCFESIKDLASRIPILNLVDFSRNEPVWVITDSSKTGVGAIYEQGKDWEHCCPAMFLSKKFANVQHNYHAHEYKNIVVLEALMKWEDKLLGQKFTLVTDHKGLEYFKTQLILSPRQTQWWEYLSHFNYTTIHVNGEWNRVADALSRYFEYNTIENKIPNNNFIKANEILNPDIDLVPVKRFVEIQSNATRRLH